MTKTEKIKLLLPEPVNTDRICVSISEIEAAFDTARDAVNRDMNRRSADDGAIITRRHAAACVMRIGQSILQRYENTLHRYQTQKAPFVDDLVAAGLIDEVEGLSNHPKDKPLPWAIGDGRQGKRREIEISDELRALLGGLTDCLAQRVNSQTAAQKELGEILDRYITNAPSMRTIRTWQKVASNSPRTQIAAIYRNASRGIIGARRMSSATCSTNEDKDNAKAEFERMVIFILKKFGFKSVP